MHFFRFAAALAALVAVSLAEVAVEKQNLALRRAIILQQYRREQLVERRTELKLALGELTSPFDAVAVQGHDAARR